MTDTATKINIFIAYAREDAAYLKRVNKFVLFLIGFTLVSCNKTENNSSMWNEMEKNRFTDYLENVYQDDGRFIFNLCAPRYHIRNVKRIPHHKIVQIREEILYLEDNYGSVRYNLVDVKSDSILMEYKVYMSQGFFAFRAKGNFVIGLETNE